MKFLLLGLGSMGRRRIRNLLELGVKLADIFGYDIREDRRSNAEKEYNIKSIENPDKIVQEVDVLIISNPPDKHLEGLKYAVKHNKRFFCESGIFDDGVKEVIREAERKNLLPFSSDTLLHCDELGKNKRTCFR